MTTCVYFKGKNLLSDLALAKYLEGLESTNSKQSIHNPPDGPILLIAHIC